MFSVLFGAYYYCNTVQSGDPKSLGQQLLATGELGTPGERTTRCGHFGPNEPWQRRLPELLEIVEIHCDSAALKCIFLTYLSNFCKIDVPALQNGTGMLQLSWNKPHQLMAG